MTVDHSEKLYFESFGCDSAVLREHLLSHALGPSWAVALMGPVGAAADDGRWNLRKENGPSDTQKKEEGWAQPGPTFFFLTGRCEILVACVYIDSDQYVLWARILDA